MSAKKPSQVGIEGSVFTGGGDIAGRDVFKIVLNIIQEKLPKNDPLPKELENTLNSLATLIHTLKTWKEVHNALDEIRIQFDQYKHPIDAANHKKQVIAHKDIKRNWLPVKSSIDNFQNRIEEAVEFEKRFSLIKGDFGSFGHKNRKNDVKECRKKSLTLIDISSQLDLRLDDAIKFSSRTEYEYLFQNIKMKIGIGTQWWNYLSDLTYELDNKITESMYLSDKLLRASAEYLHEFSRVAFGDIRKPE